MVLMIVGGNAIYVYLRAPENGAEDLGGVGTRERG